jgi:hypothetical protein
MNSEYGQCQPEIQLGYQQYSETCKIRTLALEDKSNCPLLKLLKKFKKKNKIKKNKIKNVVGHVVRV